MEDVKLSINKTQSFTEIWYEGSVEMDGIEHKFWLVDPRGKDPNGHEYDVEVRWWFKQVPREIRSMHDTIVNAYKQMKNDSKN